MKQPDDSAISRSRKTLPARRARKPRKPRAAANQTSRKKTILDRDLESELVKVFGEK